MHLCTSSSERGDRRKGGRKQGRTEGERNGEKGERRTRSEGGIEQESERLPLFPGFRALQGGAGAAGFRRYSRSAVVGGGGGDGGPAV